MSTSLTINYLSAYSPANAENGKFVKIDTSTISGYPASGLGKFAILTKSIDTPITLTNTLWVGSSSITPITNVFIPPATLTLLDIYNASNNTIYVYPATTTGALASSTGMPVTSSQKLTINSAITAFTIFPIANPADVRIFGYY